MTGTRRYRFLLIEEPECTLPVLRRRTRAWPVAPVWLQQTDPMEALLEAFIKLERRGEGNEAWAPALSDNPLSFLLDALDEAVLLRDGAGRALFGNRAAHQLGMARMAAATEPLEELEVGERRIFRRRMVFRRGDRELIIEVARRRGE